MTRIATTAKMIIIDFFMFLVFIEFDNLFSTYFL